MGTHRTPFLPFPALSKTPQLASTPARLSRRHAGLVTQPEDQDIRVSRGKKKRVSRLQPPSSSIRLDPAIWSILSGKTLPQDSCAQLLKHQCIIQHAKINGGCQAVNCDIQQYFTSYSTIQRHRVDHQEQELFQIS